MDFRHSSENKFQKQLSCKELCAISNEISKVFSPVSLVDLSKQNTLSDSLARKELLEVSQNISQYFPPVISSTTQKLVVLPVDPQHIYIYWDLADDHGSTLAQNIMDKSLKLRVYSQGFNGNKNNKKPVVDIPLKAIQSQQKVALPCTQKQTTYSATIGTSRQAAEDNTEFVPLLNSKATYAFQTTESSSYDERCFQVQDEVVADESIQTNYLKTNCSAKGKKREVQ